MAARDEVLSAVGASKVEWYNVIYPEIPEATFALRGAAIVAAPSGLDHTNVRDRDPAVDAV